MKLNKKQKTTIISTMCLLIVSLAVILTRLNLVPEEQEPTTKVTTMPTSTVTTTMSTKVTKTEAPSTSFSLFMKKTTKEKSTTLSTSKHKTTKTSKTTTKAKTKATKAKTTTKTEPKSYQYTGFENEMLKIVNNERSKHGKKALKLNSNLTSIARTRANEISQTYSLSHKRPNGSSWNTILTRLDGTSIENWETAAENIAYGQMDVEEVMDAFISSPSHYENIISGDYDYVGFGCYCKQGVFYWTQNFIGM